MMSNDQKEEMKKLIKSGFDIELISFEFEISIEELEQLKREIDNSIERKVNNKTDYKEEKAVSKIQNVKKVINNIRDHTRSSYSKLCKMRENYRALYYGIREAQDLQFTEATPQEREKINSLISEMQENIRKMQGATRKEKKDILKNIFDLIGKINNYALTMEQSEKIISLLESNEIDSIKFNTEDKLGFKLQNIKKTIVRKYTAAIDVEINETENIDQLKILQKKITLEMVMKDRVFYGGISRKIHDKILKIQQQQAIDRIKNDVSINIQRIVSNLANGTLDIEEANEVIKEEAKRRVNSKPKTRFSLNEEQEKAQILMQIRVLIAERSDQYIITDPETTTMQMGQLLGQDSFNALTSVIENLINSRKFDDARNLYKNFSSRNEFSASDNQLLKRIRNAEISDMILKLINMNAEANKEAEYFIKIEEGLKRSNIKLESISLGKSKDGLRTINLVDVWPDQDKSAMII